MAYLTGFSGGEVEYRVSTDDGSTWDAAVQFSDTPAGQTGVVQADLSSSAGAGGRWQPVWFDDSPDDWETNFDNSIALAVAGPAPTVTSVTPSSGPVAGGTGVEISGANFVSGATVTFEGVPATSVIVVTATTTTAIAPPNPPGAVDVAVTNPDGQSDTLVGGYTYFPPPVIADIVPQSGPMAGGVPATIFGFNFVAGAAVTFDGLAADSLVVGAFISVVTPPHQLGPVDVTVTNPDGQSDTRTNIYKYEASCPDRTTVDTDADGLLDCWETDGVDSDGDGTFDVDLPTFGANPLHKDLFVELDWMVGEEPSRSAIQAVIGAFANAPIDAGGTSNPDGLPGISLWVDTGTQSEGIEDPSSPNPGSCNDGIDNGGDFVTDSEDPDCLLVGHDLGEGEGIPASPIPTVDSNEFYDTKAVRFEARRNGVFRYGIRAQQAQLPTPSFGGGWGEIGGNDFIVYLRGVDEAGTIMHELGHNLNLDHGGNEPNNCKPNYVSVMNYDHQRGISQVATSTRVIDYSPPRFPGGRGQAPLATTTEDDLSEAVIYDATDPANRFAFVNGNGVKVRSQLNQRIDWNGNGTTSDAGLTVNIDIAGKDALGNVNNGLPTACQANLALSTLTGHNDWSNISLPFRQFGDSADGAINPVTDPEPDTEELEQLERAFNTSDIQITKADSSDPAVTGGELAYTLTVTNNGPNPTDDLRVVDNLPSGVSYVSDNAGCVEGPAGTLTCDLGGLLVGESKQITITVLIGAVPGSITNVATVENLAGPELDPSNNSASEQTLVAQAVEIDIKPGSDPNCINLGSEGFIPVAILATPTFDVADVDQTSLTLEGAAARVKGNSGNIGSFEDVDGDGDLDLVVQFPTADLQLTEADTEAILEGSMLDGTLIQGTNSICVVP